MTVRTKSLRWNPSWGNSVKSVSLSVLMPMFLPSVAGSFLCDRCLPQNYALYTSTVYFYFIIYNLSHTILREMVGLLVINEMERMWQEVVYHDFRYYPEILLESLKKISTPTIWDSRFPDRDLNRAHPEYKSRALPAEPPCSVNSVFLHGYLTYSRTLM